MQNFNTTNAKRYNYMTLEMHIVDKAAAAIPYSCKTLQHASIRSNMQRLGYNTLQYAETRSDTLQYSVILSNTLHYSAIPYNMM